MLAFIMLFVTSCQNDLDQAVANGNTSTVNFKVSVPAFLTLAIMPFTYNISYGIAFGLISYIVISIFCGDIKKIKVSSWVIAALFVAMLLLTH